MCTSFVVIRVISEGLMLMFYIMTSQHCRNSFAFLFSYIFYTDMLTVDIFFTVHHFSMLKYSCFSWAGWANGITRQKLSVC